MSFEEAERIKREVWRLTCDPFPDVPPVDPEKVASFFVGRRSEINMTLSTLYRGDNVLVRGTWGIGKTAFILTTLHRLQQKTVSNYRKVLPIYIMDFRGGSVDEFYQTILYSLTRVVKKSVWDRLKFIRPQEVTAIVSIPPASLQARWKTEGRSSVLEQIEGFMRRVEKKHYRLVIALDDLDKTAMQQGVINAMFHDSLHLLRDRRCAFILTSRAIARLDDLEISHLGIADSILPLMPMKGERLREMTISQLNYVRREFRDDAFPFTEDAVDEIVEKSMGIPRVLNSLCRKTLDIAAQQGYTKINSTCFENCFHKLQDNLSIRIPPEIKCILFYALERDGFLVSSKEETLEEVLALTGASTVHELLPYFDRLVQANYLVRAERADGISYKVAPGREKAAMEGRKLVQSPD